MLNTTLSKKKLSLQILRLMKKLNAGLNILSIIQSLFVPTFECSPSTVKDKVMY